MRDAKGTLGSGVIDKRYCLTRTCRRHMLDDAKDFPLPAPGLFWNGA